MAEVRAARKRRNRRRRDRDARASASSSPAPRAPAQFADVSRDAAHATRIVSRRALRQHNRSSRRTRPRFILACAPALIQHRHVPHARPIQSEAMDPRIVRPRARHRIRARPARRRARRPSSISCSRWNRGPRRHRARPRAAVPAHPRGRSRTPHRGRHARRLAEPFALAGVDAIHVVPGARARIAGRPSASFAGACAHASSSPIPIRRAGSRAGARSIRRASLASRVERARRRSRARDARRHRDVGAHVNSETAQYYGYVKDWPAERLAGAVRAVSRRRAMCVALFGNAASAAVRPAQRRRPARQDDVPRALSVVRNRCRVLVAPDSGVLTAAYYLDETFPLDVISLWSDPRQGILKQGCPSPNPHAAPRRARGRGEDVRNIAVDERSRPRSSARSPPPASPHPRACSSALTPHPAASSRGAVAARACSRSSSFARHWACIYFALVVVSGLTYGRSIAFGLALAFALWLSAGRDVLRCASRFRVPDTYLWVAVARVAGLVGRVVFLVGASCVSRGRRSAPRSAGDSATAFDVLCRRAQRRGIPRRSPRPRVGVGRLAVGASRSTRCCFAQGAIPRRCSRACTAASARSRPTSCSSCRSCRCCSRRARSVTAPGR